MILFSKKSEKKTYDRSNQKPVINACFLRIGMETRNGEQAREICKALREAGFHLV